MTTGHGLDILDGKVLLRFSHANKTGGGLEHYLNTLNRALLSRHHMTIIHAYLESDTREQNIHKEKIGEGSLIWLPLLKRTVHNSHISALPIKPVANTSLFQSLALKFSLFRKLVCLILYYKRKGSAIGEAVNCKEIIEKIKIDFSIDFMMIHSAGFFDAMDVIKIARKNRIPFGIQNHFNNKLFTNIRVAEHCYSAVAVAGVSNVGVPRNVMSKFVNLSDGIDISFYSRKTNRTPPKMSEKRNILLPARITPEKGQMDMLVAAVRLKEFGFNCFITFAGRVDDKNYANLLNEFAADNGISESVYFTGQVDQENLKELYEQSEIVALLSASEGLGRVLIEAQSMEIPCLAYDCGGVKEAVENNITGYLIPLGDINLLVEKTRLLLSDFNGAVEMGKAGRFNVQLRFSIDALVGRHEKFYERILS
jgi:glycosyltransferase involved in cell wall biosynthesis